MALQKVEATYVSDGHVVLTGPIRGTVLTSDGTLYDVTDPVIEAQSPEHAAELGHLISLRYAVEGHPTDENFKYSPAADYLADPVVQDAAVFGRIVGLQADDGAGNATMALASVTAENAALNGLSGVGSSNVIPFVSLHVSTGPSTTGANENANTGSYARQACSWNAASSGSMTNSTALTFATAGTVAVTFIGTWSSGTYAGGTYAIGAALGSSVTAASITIAAGAITLSAS